MMIALMAASAATAVSYDCAYRAMTVVTPEGNGWQISAPNDSRVGAKAEYRKFTVTVDEANPNLLEVDWADDAMNLNGRHSALKTEETLWSWAADKVSYCRLLDYNCLPSVSFAKASDAQGHAVVSAPTFGKSGSSTKQFVALQMFYSCSRKGV